MAEPERGRKVAILATVPASGEEGGAERFYDGLEAALRRQGVAAEILRVVSDEANFDAVLRSYLRFYDLDLSRFDGVISTKAPGHVARHPRHVCYLQHTMRVFYDMFDREFPMLSAELLGQRQRIHHLDAVAMGSTRLKARFVIGHQVRKRLLENLGLDAQVLYQASTLQGFHTGSFDYLFLPGRLHRWKRVDLVIAAMRHVAAPVKLLISGTGEDEAMLRRLAGNDRRIHFLGRLSDDELLGFYADALAVAFVPLLEDFGLVTIEAFLSGKPVITCTDAGEPALIVRDGENGHVVPPEPQALARCIEALWHDRALARRLGEAGRGSIAHLSWDTTARRLLEAMALPSPATT